MGQDGAQPEPRTMIGDVGFIHLRVHSAYSLLEGALPLVKALKLAVADHQPALAITDTGNLFCALEFSEKAIEKGLQPIIGCEMAVDFGDDSTDRRRPGGLPQELPSIVLLAATPEGFANLTVLMSRSFLESQPGARASLPIGRFEGMTAGIIAMTGGPSCTTRLSWRRPAPTIRRGTRRSGKWWKPARCMAICGCTGPKKFSSGRVIPTPP